MLTATNNPVGGDMTDETKQEETEEVAAKKIDELYVFATKSTNGVREAILALPSQSGGMSPLITDQKDQLPSMIELAQKVANEVKRDIVMIRLDRAEVVQEINYSMLEAPPTQIPPTGPVLVKG